MRKINIHLTVDDVTRAYISDANSNINFITKSYIMFNQQSSMIPHITLAMGVIKQNIGIDDIVNFTKELSLKVDEQTSKVLPPYLESYKNNYVFSDLENLGLSLIKKRFENAFSDTYLDIQSDYSDIAHITLAHIEEKQDMVRDYLSTVKANFECKSRFIEISDVGHKGTCINSLFKARL